MPSVTLQNIKLDVLRAFQHEDEGVVGLPMPNTATGGSTTTVVSAALKRGTLVASHFQGRNVENLTNGDSSWATDDGWDLTDTLTVSPAITAFANADSFIIWPRGLGQTIVEDEIKNVLRHTDGPYLWVPSMVHDSNLEGTDVSTDWPDVNSPNGSAFVTTAAFVLLGEQALQMSADADRGIRSQVFYVTENEQLLVSVTGSVTSSSGVTVVLYNETASETIKSVPVNEIAFTEVRFTETVPADMEQASLRFMGAAATANVYISPPVVVQSMSGRSYAAPDWLTDKGMVREAYYVPPGAASELSDTYIAGGERWPRAPKPDFIIAPRFVTPNRIQFKASSLGPLGLHCLRPFATMSANTDTTNCDREYLVSKVVANIKRKRGESKHRQFKDDGAGWAGDARNAAAIARARGYGKREMPIVANPEVVG
ncbi:hypothetical protein LCGC14_0821520 [marine sediment metagenome]|uniref:Uncharacterized protein n=1 Tax=marine sediment metagenome TaxID=412755 RepID=A0A0F9Q3Z3_9ZZZZ